MFSQLDDSRVVAFALDAAVPRVVVVGAVVVVLEVGFVVLAVIREKVIKSETIMAGDEVDTVVRGPAIVLIQVGRA